MTDENIAETTHLLKVIKKQADEIVKRGTIMVDLEEQIRVLKENTLLISAQNKQLEAMLETAKSERRKILEDNVNLEAEVKKKKEKELELTL